jgi:hypothetical protein
MATDHPLSRRYPYHVMITLPPGHPDGDRVSAQLRADGGTPLGTDSGRDFGFASVAQRDAAVAGLRRRFGTACVRTAEFSPASGSQR